MSYNTGNLIECSTLQVALEEVWQASPVTEMMPLEDVLTSAENQRGITQLILPGNGKKRNVEVTYSPRLTESVVEENVDNPRCSTETKYGNLATTYSMPDQNLGYAETVSNADMRNSCLGPNSSYILSRITAIADVLERAVATQHAEEFALLAGTWGNGIFATGNAAGQVNTSDEYVWATRYSDGRVNPEAWGQLSIARMKAGLGDTIGFGGTTAWSYLNASMAGCCSQDGINLIDAMNRFGMGYAYDKRLEAALASDDKFMVYRLGSVQPLFYVENPWLEGVAPGVIGSNYTHTSIFGPRTGMPMDLTISDNCGQVTLAVAVSTKLIAVPNDQFFSGDEYFGINGVAKVKITNP